MKYCGVDYYPEQWRLDLLEQDMKDMKDTGAKNVGHSLTIQRTIFRHILIIVRQMMKDAIFTANPGIS